jgi:beta-1,3-glucuronyltransferase
VGFYDGWNGLRKFPVDMAGFAINMELFHSTPSANMPWVAGYEEDELLRSLGVKVQDIAPLANECTEILVWHTKAVRNSWPRRPRNLKPQILANTNLNKLLVQLPQQSLAGPESSTKTIKTEENKFSFIKFFFGSL